MVKRLIQKVIRHLRGSSAKKEAVKAAKPEFKVERAGPAHKPSPPPGEFKPRRRSEERHAPREPASVQRAQAPLPRATWDPASFQVPAAEGKTRFQDLDLPLEIMHAIADLQFMYCTPIQAGTLPHTLKGRDAFGQAQTGTGKTAAFLITIFNHLIRHPDSGARRPGTPRALVLAPTRELCIQIHKDALALGKYAGLNTVAVFGGMDYEKQKNQLRSQRVDVIAATPGRLIDFKRRGDLDLKHVEVLVLDEADRMLDMGFIPDVRTIVHATPHKDRRQTLFFSATLNDDVRRLASSWTKDPVTIEVAPEHVAVDTVEQVIFIVTNEQKFALLYNILQRENARRVICFVNRRDNAERLLDKLRRYGINCALLSGAVPQDKRVKTLEKFRSGEIRVLVATDVAGRGIHVNDVTHVVNFNLPEDPEDYVHRIGRTGRAGASGTSISFADESDSFHIPDIEKFIGRPLSCTHPEDEWLVLPPPPESASAQGRSETAAPPSEPQKRGPDGPRHRGGRRGQGSRSRSGTSGRSFGLRRYDGPPQTPPQGPKAPDLPV